jgi:invasion protein IalB
MISRTASILTAAVALLSGSAHAFANHEARDLRTWLSAHSFYVADRDDPRQVAVQVNAQTSYSGETSATLPNGADTLKESYGDWGVECRIIRTQKKCSIGQFQYDQKQRTMMFSIEILPPEDGDYRVTVRMPFGLSLPDGVRLKLDDQAVERRGSFATCLPNGCLVPLKFSAFSIEMIKTARTMTVSGTALGGGQSVTFDVSLKGFSAAIERLRELR